MSLYTYYRLINKDMSSFAAAIAGSAFDYLAQGHGKEGVRPLEKSLQG